MMEKKFKKLSEIQSLSIDAVTGFQWKHWCTQVTDSNKMQVSSMPQECDKCTITFEDGTTKGIRYQKRWALETADGTVEVSASQLGNMLEAAYRHTEPLTLEGKTFTVTNNGKQGKDIRYWFKLA